MTSIKLSLRYARDCHPIVLKAIPVLLKTLAAREKIQKDIAKIILVTDEGPVRDALRQAWRQASRSKHNVLDAIHRAYGRLLV